MCIEGYEKKSLPGPWGWGCRWRCRGWGDPPSRRGRWWPPPPASGGGPASGSGPSRPRAPAPRSPGYPGLSPPQPPWIRTGRLIKFYFAHLRLLNWSNLLKLPNSLAPWPPEGGGAGLVPGGPGGRLPGWDDFLIVTLDPRGAGLVPWALGGRLPRWDDFLTCQTYWHPWPQGARTCTFGSFGTLPGRENFLTCQTYWHSWPLGGRICTCRPLGTLPGWDDFLTCQTYILAPLTPGGRDLYLWAGLVPFGLWEDCLGEMIS